MPSHGSNMGVLGGEHERKTSLTYRLGHDSKHIVVDHPRS